MKRSLKGLRILNTRPREQAHILSQQIRDAGGVVIELPTIEIQAQHTWLEQLPDLTQVQQAIFTSANAVEHCFKYLNNWPSTIQVIAIGQGTAKALTHYHIPIHATPQIADSEHLLRLPSLSHPQNQTILLFKGEGGRGLIEETLHAQGADLISLCVYKRILPQINPKFIKSIWHDDLVDIILLTSEQSMHHLFMLFAKEAHPWLRQKPCLVLSKRLAQAANSLGIKTILLSSPHEMMHTLFDYVMKD